MKCKACSDETYVKTTKKGTIINYTHCKKHTYDIFRESARKSAKTRSERVGDRYEDKNGYVIIRDSLGRAVAEHRVVMEKKLNRTLLKWESVHHINGIRNDNHPDNLELWVGGVRYGQRAKDLVCPHCGKQYRS